MKKALGRRILGAVLILAPFYYWLTSYNANNCAIIDCKINILGLIIGIILGAAGLYLLFLKTKDKKE